MGGNPEAAATAALVWFGVILCVNMRISFMHPPFRFALFSLRGIGPRGAPTESEPAAPQFEFEKKK